MLRINGHEVAFREAIGWSALVGGPDLVSFAIEQVALAQMARSRGFEADAQDVRDLFNEFRYLKQLESGDALKRWMADHDVSVADIQTACEQIVLRRMLRDTISDEDIKSWFAEHRPSFERAEIYRIIVEDRDQAQELYSLVTEEDESFSLLAIEHSTDADTAKMGGYVGEVARADVAGEREALIFAASPGDVVPPMKTDLGWEIVLVHYRQSRQLDDVATEIRDTLFNQMITDAVARVDLERGSL